MNPRFPKLTKAVLDAVAKGKPPFTAEDVTREVRMTWPLATHQSVVAELAWLVEQGKAQLIRQPHLPARFTLNKQIPHPDDEQLRLMP